MRTPFEYSFDGEELYSHDGLPLTPVFKDSTADAERLARQDQKYSFELRRRRIEEGELEDMFAMASGEGPNTMVVESDFPPELMDAEEDLGGYNVSRKQTFLRVIYRKEDGSLVMLSQTLEGSDRDGLEAIREFLGFDTEEGELLGQRMKFDADPEQQEFLVDMLQGVYDRKLEEKNGGSYRAGWRMATARADVNTYDFVCAQQDLLEAYEGSVFGSNDSEMYALAAAMKYRYERMLDIGTTKQSAEQYTYYEPPQNVLEELQLAARTARARGETFSGCGKSVTSKDPLSESFDIVDQLDELGFGNRAEEESGQEQDEYGSLTFDCPNGHKNKRPRGQLIDRCKTCKCSVKC